MLAIIGNYAKNSALIMTSREHTAIVLPISKFCIVFFLNESKNYILEVWEQLDMMHG